MRFAIPNIWDINARQTASSPELLSFLGGRGWGSYGPLWKKMPRIWKGSLADAEIASWWKTAWLIDGMKALRDQYKVVGAWYPLSQDARWVGGVKLKTSARGVLFTPEHGPEVHVINPRKSQFIDRQALSFLARAAYEEHVIDDPNSPRVAVLDLGSKKRSKTRDVQMYRGDFVDMMSVEHFEYAVNAFFEALKLADAAQYGSISAVSVSEFRIPR